MRASEKWTKADHERAYEEWSSRWTMEDAALGTPQSAQRDIIGAGLQLLEGVVANFHHFQELTLTYPTPQGVKAMCPDTLVVLGFLPECDRNSFPVGFEPSDPFWVVEYVSNSTANKDYEENFTRYGRELKIPYYLLFDPRDRDHTFLQLHRHDGHQSFIPVEPNLLGRLEIPELELEIALVGRWARLWHRGQLLHIPTELAQQIHLLSEQLGQRDEKLARVEKDLTEKEEKLAEVAKDLSDRERALTQTRKVLDDREEQLRQARAQGCALIGMLRGVLETRARATGRDDILAALPTTEDPEQLQRWLAEIG